MNLLARIEKKAKQMPLRVALVQNNRERTLGELREDATKLAKNLQELNLKKGDRLLCVLGNGWDFSVTLLACWKAGAVFVPLNPLYKKTEMASLYNNADPKLVVCEDSLAPLLQSLSKVPVISQTGKPFSLSLIVQERMPQLALPSLAGSDPAVIMYTSGTTSHPKGVVLTHQNLFSNVQAIMKALRVHSDDVILTALPLYHSFGLTCCLLTSVTGGLKNIILERFVPQKVFDLVKEHQVTFLPGVPTMFDYLLNHPGKRPEDFASLRLCFSGGAPLYLETLKAFESTFGVELREGYGLTETSPLATCTPLGALRKIGSTGTAIPGVEVSIRDEQGNLCPPNTVGEIVIRGENVMQGYFKDKTGTEQVLQDGWLLTGDLGKLDEDSYLYIVGRKKDMAIIGGFNVYPQDIAEVLLRHPKVADAFVKRTKDKGKGEAIAAYVVPKKGAKLHYEEVLDFARENLTAYKVPRFIEVVKSLPRTATGKVDRRKVE